MLKRMIIENIALIERVDIYFYKGLNVLSGETGAGKSIVVDAVSLLLGSRADRVLIRSGEEKAYVEAFFDISKNLAAINFLKEQMIETTLEEEIAISREISLTGRNICRIGGIATTLTLFREFTSLIMDIHGQSEHQVLLDKNLQLAILDDFGGKSQLKLVKEVERAYKSWYEGSKRWRTLKKRSDEKQTQIDNFNLQITELTDAKLKEKEDINLKKEIDLYRNSEKLIKIYNKVSEIFFGNDDKEGVLTNLKTILDEMRELVKITGDKKNETNQIENIFYELENISEVIQTELDKIDFSPKQYEEIAERLDFIRRLERKYGKNIEELILFLEQIKEERKDIIKLEVDLEEEKEKQIRALRLYREKAGILTSARKKIAKDFCLAMEEQLKELGMERIQFSIDFKETEKNKPILPKSQGDEEIEFLIAPNIGEPLQPLNKIASGGELSRIMLSIKALTSKSGFIGTMIFDEIDTGISGKIAWEVGKKMAEIAKYQQVICVTHLAQIFAMADYSYLVKKHEKKDRTVTELVLLKDESKIEELVRLIGGQDGTARITGVNHAISMLKEAELVKKTNI